MNVRWNRYNTVSSNINIQELSLLILKQQETNNLKLCVQDRQVETMRMASLNRAYSYIT